MNALLSFATGVASPVIPCRSAEVIRSHTRRSRYRGPQSPITSSAKSCGAQARADIVSSLTNHKEVGQGVALIHQCGHVSLSPARRSPTHQQSGRRGRSDDTEVFSSGVMVLVP